MKLLVLGFGQCGNRIADEFNKLDARARFHRRMSILSDAFAVNTDNADLSMLSSIKSDYVHRILIGNRKTNSHGVGKINALGAQIAKQDGDKIINAIRSTERFYESDAFLLIASASGGTGSGAMPIIGKILKERFKDKPVYALVVMPFEHEEKTGTRTIFNSATCLKATYSVADAVFLVDNQRYIEKDSSLMNNLDAINKLIVEPFYDLLCAGEETKSKHIGAKILDAGDIINTLKGWTVLGYGVAKLSAIRLPFLRRNSYKDKGAETAKGIQTMDQAMSNLTFDCDPKDAASALYLLSAPAEETTMNLVNELVDYLGEVAPRAMIRYGDYPRRESTLKTTVILSQLNSVDKVVEYYNQVPRLLREQEQIQGENDNKLDKVTKSSKMVPSLFDGNGN
ncbi:tubulin/FtsZ family protein [Chloroflexota bacterium]